MYARLIVLAVALVALVGCNSRESSEPAQTPLPTRQTIDSVNKKLDTAREDAERRRQQADDAHKQTKQ
ncbi:MAG TPA: hypothetical protein VM937_02825 [Burkholderiaceae bacterium]|jgi:hypothetical protein|nr:hypothetical protein [Burkholderiaceae bacterium]